MRRQCAAHLIDLMSTPSWTISHSGLISRSRQATARLSHLEATPLREATAWLVTYQEFWDESYDRLDALIAASQENQSD